MKYLLKLMLAILMATSAQANSAQAVWTPAELLQAYQHLESCGAATTAPDVYTNWVGTKPTAADIITELQNRNTCA